MNKSQNINIRVSERDKETIKRQAESKQMTVSEYLVYLARLDAEKGS